MPRITAATVAEHRAKQRAVLLAAARDLILSDGYAAMSFTALARKTGLARPTIYSYFQTREDVVIALCELELPQVAAAIDHAVARANGPRERLAAFVTAQLRAAQQQRYRLAHALIEAPLSDQTRASIVALHRDLMPNAGQLLRELGHPHPDVAAGLLQGLINSAVAALDAGQPPRRVIGTTVDAVLNGLAPDRPRASGADTTAASA